MKKEKKEIEKKIKIIPLGGLDGIGKNITLFEYEDDIIIVDCGIKFPSDEMPGIDFIIPDFSYLIKNKSRIKGLVVTHGHEDHIGAIPYLLMELNIPIYSFKLTIGLIQSRLEEKKPKSPPVFVEAKPHEPIKIGKFTVEFIRVNHSIIDGASLAIKTDAGTIIHTGDFKIDFTPVDGHVTDLTRFAEIGEQGVLLLMSDSTNAERPGFTRSESILEKKLVDIFSSARGKIIVATFASNIHRIQQIFNAAKIYNKFVTVTGLSMLKNIEIASKLGYLNINENMIVSVEKANALPPKKLVVIGTGSQGEPMSALSRISAGTHKFFKVHKGDTVIITASVIPGNERMVYNVVNGLMRLGVEVHYERDPDIHVSGHGSEEELKLMISLTRPKFFMPIHGEYKHLIAHTKIAELLGIKPSMIHIANNGDIMELSNKSFKKNGVINLSEIYVDGQEIGNLESSLITDRQTMSTEGIIFITIVTSDGMLIREPEIQTRGLVGVKNVKVLNTIRHDAEKEAHRLLAKHYGPREVEMEVTKHMKNSIYKLVRRNPLINVQVVDI